jgi:hypothetical protein
MVARHNSGGKRGEIQRGLERLSGSSSRIDYLRQLAIASMNDGWLQTHAHFRRQFDP